MDIVTKTVTTKVHTATVSQDDLKGVALLAVKGRAGITDEASIVSSTVDIDADGTLKIEIVEAVSDAAGAAPVAAAALAINPSIQIPTVLGASATA